MKCPTGPTRSATRWAALGAAVAVSLGAGGFGIARATSPSGAAAFVPITPCRLFDTRPDFQVGERGTPIGESETFTVAATGPQGDCDLPSSAVGVVLNMTAVEASAPTFLTVWPAGGEQPNASSLNPMPGPNPTVNAVVTDLSDGGEFSVFNRFGSVHVIADAVGYYTDHRHDDRYYTEAEIDAKLADVAGGTDAELSAKLDALEASLDALGAAHDQLASDLADAHDELASTRGDLASTQAELASTQDQLEQTDQTANAAATAAAQVRRPVPSGTTITGSASVDLSTTGAITQDSVFVDFPAVMPPMTSVQINMGDHAAADPLDVDPSCSGTASNPTAPAGRICVYIQSANRVSYVAAGITAIASDNAFRVNYYPNDPTPGRSLHLTAVWAYTAP